MTSPSMISPLFCSSLVYEAPQVEIFTNFALARIAKPYSLKGSLGRCFSAWPAHTQPEPDLWQANRSVYRPVFGIVSVVQGSVMVNFRTLWRNIYLKLAKYWA